MPGEMQQWEVVGYTKHLTSPPMAEKADIKTGASLRSTW
jgi:hypothetical protein